jgi:hypothetical protein
VVSKTAASALAAGTLAVAAASDARAPEARNRRPGCAPAIQWPADGGLHGEEDRRRPLRLRRLRREIHESVLTLLALDRRGAEAVLCAPDAPQMHVVNHLSGQVEEGAGLEAMGATHVACAVSELAVDREKKLVSTPAYMLGQRICEVADGIDAAVGALLEMAREARA